MKSNWLLLPLCSTLAIACSTAAKGEPGLRTSSSAPSDALWNIVNQCVSRLQTSGTPAPCLAVDLSQGVENGYAVLKDQRGASHFLLIPTKKVTGIEDPSLTDQNSVNYWQKAFENLPYVERALGKKMPLDALAVGVNSVATRSQNQLHLHLDCLAPEVYRWIQTAPVTPTTEVSFKTEKYRVSRFALQPNQFINLFHWLHDRLGSAESGLPKHALALVLKPTADGGSEVFVFDSDSGTLIFDRGGGSADLLMDRSCALANRL